MLVIRILFNTMFIVGKTLRQLVDHQIAHKQRMTNQDIGSWIKHQHQGLQWIYAKRLEPIFQDMQKAKASIMISLPEKMVLAEDMEK